LGLLSEKVCKTWGYCLNRKKSSGGGQGGGRKHTLDKEGRDEKKIDLTFREGPLRKKREKNAANSHVTRILMEGFLGFPLTKYGARFRNGGMVLGMEVPSWGWIRKKKRAWGH